MGRVSQQGDQRQTESDRDGEAEMQRRPGRRRLLPGWNISVGFRSSWPSYLQANIPKHRTLNPDTVCSFCSEEGCWWVITTTFPGFPCRRRPNKELVSVCGLISHIFHCLIRKCWCPSFVFVIQNQPPLLQLLLFTIKDFNHTRSTQKLVEDFPHLHVQVFELLFLTLLQMWKDAVGRRASNPRLEGDQSVRPHDKLETKPEHRQLLH